MEVSRLTVESELQLLAYTTATVKQDLSHVCKLHHSSQQQWIFNPLREARDWTCNLMVTSWIGFCCATMGTPVSSLFIYVFIYLFSLDNFFFLRYRKLQGLEQTVEGKKELGCICPWVDTGCRLCIFISKVIREIPSFNTLVNNGMLIFLMIEWYNLKKSEPALTGP